jgi:hypothetical protein
MNFDICRSYFKDGSQIRTTKRVMAENWPDPSQASKNALWDVVLDAWEEVAHSEVYAATLIESLPRRMQMVIDSEGYWTPY